MMKKNVLIASGMLASVLILNTHATSAMEQLPYSTSASTFAQGNSHSTGPNAGPSKSGSMGPMSRSYSSANEYSLHSSSAVFDNYYLDIPAIPNGVSQEVPQVKPLSTFGRASINQVFTVLNSGTATLNFAWDGSLFSNGDYNSGYHFDARATMSVDGQNKGNTLGSFSSGQNITGGSVSIDLFDSIELSFSENDIGKTFLVSANLHTSVDGRNNNLIKEEIFNTLATATLTSDSVPVSDGPIAYSDFSRTATFSFTGQGVIAPAAVPVPAAVWLFGSALLGLVGTRRKKAA